MATPTPNPNTQPFIKNVGVTSAERYLNNLCQRNFLSLWSYPGVFRNQGQQTVGADGKEICDLLVVCGDHVIIFSDKHCRFNDNGNLSIAWKRWFKKAIWESAEQCWGAKRWIEQFPSRVFLDKKCSQPIPIGLPDPANARFHLVVVAHGVSIPIANHFNGSGSLIINTGIKGKLEHDKPFHIGDVAPERPFIHVLDDHSLHTLMGTRDTISDFVAYLEKREKLFRGPITIWAPGEEELLPFYLKKLNSAGEHDFVFPIERCTNGIAVEEGYWAGFQKHPQRIAQLEQDKISYLWDSLIEHFSQVALTGKQLEGSGGLKDTEKILRFMARESRFKRRALSRRLHDMLQSTPNGYRRLGVVPSITKGDPYYVLLLFPFPTDRRIDYGEYRKVRAGFLEACCLVTRLMYPQAEDIVGLATEPGLQTIERSEDACYFDARAWTEEMAAQAREDQRQLGILTRHVERRMQASEYPDVPVHGGKVGRNERCPCGSGKKYKKCCLA